MINEPTVRYLTRLTPQKCFSRFYLNQHIKPVTSNSWRRSVFISVSVSHSWYGSTLLLSSVIADLLILTSQPVNLRSLNRHLSTPGTLRSVRSALVLWPCSLHYTPPSLSLSLSLSLLASALPAGLKALHSFPLIMPLSGFPRSADGQETTSCRPEEGCEARGERREERGERRQQRGGSRRQEREILSERERLKDGWKGGGGSAGEAGRENNGEKRCSTDWWPENKSLARQRNMSTQEGCGFEAAGRLLFSSSAIAKKMALVILPYCRPDVFVCFSLSLSLCETRPRAYLFTLIWKSFKVVLEEARWAAVWITTPPPPRVINGFNFIYNMGRGHVLSGGTSPAVLKVVSLIKLRQ